MTILRKGNIALRRRYGAPSARLQVPDSLSSFGCFHFVFPNRPACGAHWWETVPSPSDRDPFRGLKRVLEATGHDILRQVFYDILHQYAKGWWHARMVA
jgi:hypothetical protein